jgi:hypothetical protein
MHALTFKDGSHPSGNKLYYAFAGSHAPGWYWDEQLKYPVDTTISMLNQDATALPDGDIRANALAVTNIIEGGKDSDGNRKEFFFVIASSSGGELVAQKITVVDRAGMLLNGDKLNDDADAFVEGTTGEYVITLYDKYGNKTGTVTLPY